MIMSRSGTILHERGTHQLFRSTIRRVWRLCIAALLATTIVLPCACAQGRQREEHRPAFRYFAATGHNLGGPFLSFYDTHGGEPIFGAPLTETIDGDPQIQYFERARLERRGHAVSLSLLGSELTAGRGEATFAPLAASPAPDRLFYTQSGHTLGGAFQFFWQTTGGLPVFGYPISEEFVEDGTLVQYFERSRFEYRPDIPDPHVSISPLGYTYARLMGVRDNQLAAAPPIVPLGTAAIAIYDSARHNVALAAEKIDGATIAPGATFSFLEAIDEVSQRNGYTQGQAIVDGGIGTVIGGGICYVATALYRAAFLAGLPIVERRAHSLALASFSDIPGFDAAVDTIGLDLRWRNDTPSTIAIAAELYGGQLSITLWGIGDGRSTTMRGPTVKRDTTTQHVTIGRVVRAASGALIRKETVQSHYRIAQGDL